jgi:malonate-semialdehyde dehydrogenase (acetylating)/methylmalonate-semialdehyde dehydrogenase
MLVLPDADLDLAADAAVNAGFGSAGERCMAISVIVAVEPVADELIAKIAKRMSGLKVGDGMRGCDMGPLITQAHRDKVTSYIDIAIADGANVAVDGRGIDVDGEASGFWLGPTMFDKVSTDSAVYQDETFGPVLSVIRVASYTEGLDLINTSQYGNGTAIFTNDGGAARRFQNEVQSGMIGINVPNPVPVAYHSFGGMRVGFGSTSVFAQLEATRRGAGVGLLRAFMAEHDEGLVAVLPDEVSFRLEFALSVRKEAADVEAVQLVRAALHREVARRGKELLPLR